jgi:hypothetical protein
VYTLEKDNSRANTLSQRYDIAGTKHKDEGTLFKQNQDRFLKLAIKINNILTITNKVLEELQEAIIREHHDNLVHRHPSITRTIELI